MEKEEEEKKKSRALVSRSPGARLHVGQPRFLRSVMLGHWRRCVSKSRGAAESPTGPQSLEVGILKHPNSIKTDCSVFQ